MSVRTARTDGAGVLADLVWDSRGFLHGFLHTINKRNTIIRHRHPR